MSKTDSIAELRPAEADLGQALALIHRILPRLEEPGRVAEVQAALRRAAACIESARKAHEKDFAPRAADAGTQRGATNVRPEIVAVIAAAVAVVLERPHRLVSVQRTQSQVPYLNVWALEGRTQIFQSHKTR